MTPIKRAKELLASPLVHYDEAALRPIISELVDCLENDPKQQGVPRRLLLNLSEADPQVFRRLPEYLKETVRQLICCLPERKL